MKEMPCKQISGDSFLISQTATITLERMLIGHLILTPKVVNLEGRGCSFFEIDMYGCRSLQ